MKPDGFTPAGEEDTPPRPRAPIQHREFVDKEANRRRYWARSMLGWPVIARTLRWLEVPRNVIAQRLRDVINKNVTEEQLLETAERVFARGWQKMKLYFMAGLPTETDEDVAGTGELVTRVLATAREATPPEQRGSVRVAVSVSTFVPKAHTPFQWNA